MMLILRKTIELVLNVGQNTKIVTTNCAVKTLKKHRYKKHTHPSTINHVDAQCAHYIQNPGCPTSNEPISKSRTCISLFYKCL